jgi:hypothetical protein
MIATLQPTLLDMWRRRFGGKQRRTGHPRRAAALGYMAHGLIENGLIEVGKLTLAEFEIAAADGKFVPVEATIDGETVSSRPRMSPRPARPLRLAERDEPESGQQEGPGRLAVPDQQLAGRHGRVRAGRRPTNQAAA